MKNFLKHRNTWAKFESSSIGSTRLLPAPSCLSSDAAEELACIDSAYLHLRSAVGIFLHVVLHQQIQIHQGIASHKYPRPSSICLRYQRKALTAISSFDDRALMLFRDFSYPPELKLFLR